MPPPVVTLGVFTLGVDKEGGTTAGVGVGIDESAGGVDGVGGLGGVVGVTITFVSWHSGWGLWLIFY